MGFKKHICYSGWMAKAKLWNEFLTSLEKTLCQAL